MISLLRPYEEMESIVIVFWIFILIVFYTYIGYGIILFAAVKIKEMRHKPQQFPHSSELPDITLFITAYNEEDVVDEKMGNCLSLDYPKERLHIVWVTDGSNDRTNELLSHYPEVTVYYEPERRGKMAAMNRGMKMVNTPFVVFTDANTTLNADALKEMIRAFDNPRVGCVAGEKRIGGKEKQDAVQGGEGAYWKYESALKSYDARLYSTIGTAGELFAIRRELFREIEPDTLLDDFILSMRITMEGYVIAYCSKAYAIEAGSSDMREEEKRKVRIAAGGLQSIARLSPLLNPFRYGTLSFQYVSHRVLRWSVAPFMLFALLPLNFVLYLGHISLFYDIVFYLQLLFYAAAAVGYYMQNRQLKMKVFFIPYYFLFMNINVFKGIGYLARHKGTGTWTKSNRRTL
jgi:cellulose synthase/poly-beta-1,6-N-acetylglucosamine synthase-like glycosyltransferase